MPSDFVHLHLHTHYSLLDGACEPNKLAELAKEYNMSSVAITDHGTMGGVVDFYKAMNKHGIKPVIGCEMYVSPTNYLDKNKNQPNIKGYHLVLLAKNNTGYHNLCKLMSEASINGYYYHPRIDKKLLRKYSEGLIGMSACLGGELNVHLLNNEKKKAKEALSEYLDILGRDNFYIELMDHGMAEQKKCNKELISLSREFDIPLLATNDVHYLKKEHAKSHEILLCVATNSKLEDTNRLSFIGKELHFKSRDEMMEIFKDIPEALTNTVKVAERCNVELDFETSHYPVYDIPDSMGRKDFLKKKCHDAIPEKYGFNPQKENLNKKEKNVLNRINHELDIIDSSGYCSYFLVVADFIQYARKNDIPVGPGRGSGAGSIVAYLTEITDVDPLRYYLLFERFLNPERVSPPDFDIDFCEKRRDEVIEYVKEKYGKESVAQIATYGTLKPKAVIKDVARVLGKTFEESDKITKLIPGKPSIKTIEQALNESPDLRMKSENDPEVKEILDYAEPLEGLNRHLGVHAAGVIIGDQRLDRLVPLGVSKNEIITQYTKNPCEELGLLKMDFLGLSTLTIIQNAVKIIRKTQNVDIDIEKLPMDDKKTFELINKGDTVGIFQLESPGMQNLCRQFGVEIMEHILALIAIYRPGPMNFIPEFVARKMGREKVEYDHPKMEKILRETYGIMLYQEQIMQVVQELAGFTLGGADILRRAIGKKKSELLMEQKAKFIEGCSKANSIRQHLAEEIWNKIEKFADYGFNKSHSAAYGIIAYRTAYLKAHFPVEFMAANLSNALGDSDKIEFLIGECGEMNIDILPPNVNKSFKQFSVSKGSILFGLAAIKGFGSAAADKVITERKKDGEFKSILDFCERVGSMVNSKKLEHLIRSGAFDKLENLKRSQMVAIIPDLLNTAAKSIKDKEIGQTSLFDAFGEDEEDEINNQFDIPDIPEFDEHSMLQDEKKLLGFYVTGHPLAEYSKLIEKYSTHNLGNSQSFTNNQGLKLGVMINSVKKQYSKKHGKEYAVLKIEDMHSSINCMIYSKLFSKLKNKEIKNIQNNISNSENDNSQINYSETQNNYLNKQNDKTMESVSLFENKHNIIKQNNENKIKDDKTEKLFSEKNDNISIPSILKQENTVFIEAIVSKEEETQRPTLIAQSIIPITDTLKKHSKEIHIHLHEKDVQNKIDIIKNILAESPGKTEIIFCLKTINHGIIYVKADDSFTVEINTKILKKISELLGETQHSYKIIPDKKVPKAKSAYHSGKFRRSS